MADIPERLMPGTPTWDRYISEHRQRYEFIAPLLAGKIVLDAACGVGYGSQILALAGARHVTGVDINGEAILEARTRFSEVNTSFHEADVTQLPMPNEFFDAVISFETIEHLQSPRPFLEELQRVLRPDGLLVISSPNREFEGRNTSLNPYHVSEMTFVELNELVGEFFLIRSRYTQTHSPAYLRYLRLVTHLNHLDKAIRYSTLLKFENGIRRLLNRWTPSLPPVPSGLSDATPGDFDIYRIDAGLPHHLTFILEATKA